MGGEENWMDVLKRYKPQFGDKLNINYIMHNMINVIDTTICCI